jgi:hypothetical protein
MRPQPTTSIFLIAIEYTSYLHTRRYPNKIIPQIGTGSVDRYRARNAELPTPCIAFCTWDYASEVGMVIVLSGCSTEANHWGRNEYIGKFSYYSNEKLMC